MAQLTYSYATPQAVAGGIADISDYVINSRINSETDGVLKFGMGVTVGSTPGTNVALPSASTDAFEGVVTNGFTTEHNLTGTVALGNKATVGCMTKGKIWAMVAPSESIAYNNVAYCYYSGSYKGCFGATSTYGLPVGTFKGAFATASKAYGIGLVELGYDHDTLPA